MKNKVFREVFTVNGLDKELNEQGQTSTVKAVDENNGIRSFGTYNEALEFIKSIDAEEFEKSVFSIEKHFGMFEEEEQCTILE